MPETEHELLTIRRQPEIEDGTLVLAFDGWMDGGEVSTGTVGRLVDLLEARPVAEIDPEPFYIFNVPGPMEIATLFRPHVEYEEGLIKTVEMPTNTFYAHEPANLILFLGKEPNLRWRTFSECVFRFAREMNIRRILFVGSFGGTVPHTREPRLYIACSSEELLTEMEPYGVRRNGYTGPGSITSYLNKEAPAAGFEMVSLVAEIPGYLEGRNPSSIEAVTRRLSKMLKLSLDLDSLRSASTEWEMEVSQAVEQDDDLAEKVRQMEDEYDNDLLDLNDEQA